VTVETVLKLIVHIRKLEDKLLKKAIDLPGYAPEVQVFIRSGGGDVHAGMSAMDHMLNSKVKIITVADGMCASAATFILLGGRVRKIRAHAYVLIHQISVGGFWGNFEELKDEVNHCAQIMDMLKSVYREYTGIPAKVIATLMKKDVYLTAEECLSYKVVHALACLGTA
jgi:ATP-dependent Clp endopeptidase proteolytic subunit ClpP